MTELTTEQMVKELDQEFDGFKDAYFSFISENPDYEIYNKFIEDGKDYYCWDNACDPYMRVVIKFRRARKFYRDVKIEFSCYYDSHQDNYTEKFPKDEFEAIEIAVRDGHRHFIIKGGDL